MTAAGICDVHCHFFSTSFFAALAAQRSQSGASPDEVYDLLQWERPGAPEALADRWLRELDAHGVRRAALIASVPGDEESVAAAVSRHPSRFVGFFMLDPSAPDATARAARAVAELGLRGICLFPAMHHVSLDDERVWTIVDAAARRPGVAVFVHCGVLTVGVRRKLGLPSRFDLRLGDPRAVARLALAFPRVPFIIPHFGAGTLQEVLMAGDVCPNLHVDTSSSNHWTKYTPGLTLQAVFESALAVLGPTRILFGTDSSFFPRGWQRGVYDAQRQVLDALKTSTEDAALIFGGNFDAMFTAPPEF